MTLASSTAVRARTAHEGSVMPAAVRRAIAARTTRGPAPAGASRKDVLRALKHARSALGLSPSTWLVIEELCLKVPERDWVRGTPLVFATNLSLAHACHCAPRTLIRHVNDAERLGLITRRSSSNRKRYQVRTDEDDVADGRGIDLAPLLERLAELRELAARHDADYERRTREAQSLMERRRALHDLAHAFRELAADDVAAEMLAVAIDRLMPKGRRRKADLILLTGAQRRDLAEALAALDDVWFARFEEMLGRLPSPAPEGDETVTLPIRQQNPHPSSSAGARPARGPSGKEGERPSPARIPLHVMVKVWPSFFSRLASFDPPGDLFVHAEAMRREMGIADALWGDACIALNHDRRALVEIVAYLHERVHSRDRGYRIAGADDPGGYFRALTNRAKDGRLRLAVSAFARLGRDRSQ